MRTKTCFKCGEEKPLKEFYRHSMMADGRLGKCKECAKADTRENRSKRRSQYSAYERERTQRPSRRAKQLEYQQAKRARYPERNRARAAINNAIKDGKVERGSCEVYGTANAQAHHEDYSKPFDVRWLCFQHHREEHGQVVGF